MSEEYRNAAEELAHKLQALLPGKILGSSQLRPWHSNGIAAVQLFYRVSCKCPPLAQAHIEESAINAILRAAEFDLAGTIVLDIDYAQDSGVSGEAEIVAVVGIAE